MNLQEKIEHLKELQNIQYPSDQDLEDIESLKENIRLELKESVFRGEPETKQEPKQYRGIISGKIEKWRDERREKNKTTPDMLRQLELDARRAELEARIEIAKAKKKKNKTGKLDFKIPGKIFTESSGQDYEQLKRALGKNNKEYSAL